MKSGQPRVITLRDLAQLPLRANVTLAVRCARRIRPCFKLPADAPRRREQTAAVDAAIRVAAAFCRGLPGETGRAADIVRLAETVAEETCELTRFSGYAAVHAAQSAACAEEAVRNPSDANVIAVVVAAFGAVRVLSANSDPFALERVVAAMYQDFENLLSLAPGAIGDLGPALDPSENGPLGSHWPAGIPACFAPD